MAADEMHQLNNETKGPPRTPPPARPRPPLPPPSQLQLTSKNRHQQLRIEVLRDEVRWAPGPALFARARPGKYSPETTTAAGARFQPSASYTWEVS
jgi:hypothetical protein